MNSDDDFENDDEDYTYEEDVEYEEEEEEEEEVVATTTNDDRKVSATPENNNVTNHSSAGSRRSSMEVSKELVIPRDSYTIAYSTDVQEVMDRIVDELSNLLELSPDETIALLRYCKWDKERLMDGYFGNPDKLRKGAGIEKYSANLISSQIALLMEGSNSTSDNDKDQMITCKICYDPEVPSSNCFSLGCNHQFCSDCYREYLRSQLTDGPTCILTTCPEHKCTELVTSRVFHTFLPKEATETYDKFLLRNYIENSKSMKYCPAAGCNKVALGTGISMARCSCGHPFCFKPNCMSDEAHDPCSCQQLSEWQLKCMNESETANWILANTRKCPNCNTRIEKNQGCNHMTCRLCKYDFCWICMGPWNEHGQNTGGYYKCNRFNAVESDSAVNEQQKAQAELNRYLHYYQRFHAHDYSLKFASSARAQAEARMIEQQEVEKSSWIDVQFLKQAAEQLIDCRRVLKYTYVLGYYLKDNSAEKRLFEHHQEMLEKNTEKLQEYTERPLDTIDRAEVVNLTRVTEKFMNSLLGSMTGGIVTVDDTSLLINSTSSSSNSATSNNSSG